MQERDRKGREIRIIDTTLRDAHQCLWATRMTTAHMLPVAERMDRCGFAQIDLAGAIQFDVCVRYLREDPWLRVRLMRERCQQTPLRALIRSRNIMSFDLVPDDIIELWVERLVANGFRVVGAFDGLNDVDNMLASIRVAKRLGVRVFGALAYSLSPVHTDELYVKTAQDLIERGRVDAIMIKDAGGLLTPERIRTLVPALRAVAGDTPLELHSHCLTGLAPLVYLEGADLGVDEIHSSIAPLANGAAQPATQSMARALRHRGYRIAVDDALIDEVGEHFRRIAEREGKPLGAPLEYDPFHYEHQIPGGMLSNFRSQLEHAGILHKFDELLEECARVRRELGWPIMITPFAQLVGTQAVLNVVRGQRYEIVPDEVKKYALGYYGKLLAPVEPQVLDRIVENGSKRIALEPSLPPPGVAELRRKYPNAGDDERLLRFMFAGPQVDEMIAQVPASLPLAARNPIVHLVQELTRRPKVGRIYISKGDLKLELVRDGAP
ncbi:MAG: pyruvate carboxylase subunit B [Betaproteobacteria bacterium]|nr:pyruvate carboxylase subunit B [Betaproteobacteria bacterium]